MSLPRTWCKLHGLTKDSEVTIIENQDGSLLVSALDISTEKPKFKTTVVFDAKDIDDMDLIELEIITRYLDGHDEIIVERKDAAGKINEKFPPKFTLKVQEVVQSLLGLEITSFLSSKIKITDIMSIQETNVHVLVKIIADTTIDLFQSVLDLFQSLDFPSSVQSLSLSKRQVRKYYLRILRELRKGLLVPASLSRMGLTAQDTVDMAFFITDVNETSEKLDFIIHTFIIENASSLVDAVVKQVHDFMQEINDVFRKSVDAFLFKKKKDAVAVVKEVPGLEHEKRDIENKIDEYTDSARYVHFQIILDILSKILDHCNSIALSALRRII